MTTRWYDVCMGNLTESEAFRFASKYVERNDCLIWTSPLDKDGYGTFYLRRKNRRAHRVAWFNWFGEIPAGHVINHKCRNRSCVNPQHLELITIRENALQDSAGIGAINARKVTCPSGHAYDREYTGSNGKTQRYCSTCEAAKQKRLRARWATEDTLRV